jgi:hypothetical protein
VFFGHQDLEASLKFLNSAGQFAPLALRGSRLGLAGARQIASHLGDLGAHGFFALDQIVTAQRATSGRRRVTASTSVSASAWSLYPWNEMRSRT